MCINYEVMGNISRENAFLVVRHLLKKKLFPMNLKIYLSFLSIYFEHLPRRG